MQSMQIEKNIPMPTQSAKVKFQTDKTIHQVLRAMDTMAVGDSILISTNSVTGRSVTESTLKTWLKKFYMNRYNLDEFSYKKAVVNKGGYNLWMFDYDDEYAERSIDKDSATKEYSWINHNSFTRYSNRRKIELQRCKDENDFTMVEKYLGWRGEHKLCTIETPKELIEAAKRENLEAMLLDWDALDFKLKCQIPKPTIENIPLNLSYSGSPEPGGPMPAGYRSYASLTKKEQYHNTLSRCATSTYWLDEVHENHDCEFEHPLEKRWSEQEVSKCLGYRLWRI